jgi:polyketide cyclase/dehydrase/lipid transport protein
VPATRRASRKRGTGSVTLSDPELPIEGYVELDMPVDEAWRIFTDVARWPRWNRSFCWARVLGGRLKVGATLIWMFNPIRSRYIYKLPSIARIVECEPQRKVTWEVTALPGFHALHSYVFESLGPNRCRFGSWEVAEGVSYRLMRRFWLAHFRYVCHASVEGARTLVRRRR